MFIIIPINIVKVYYNSALILYAKELVLKAVIAIFIIFTAISTWLKALLAGFIRYKVSKSCKIGSKRLL